MKAEFQSRGKEIVQVINAFLATYDKRSASDRQISFRIRERLQGELYRREREQFPEWIDLGGEA